MNQDSIPTHIDSMESSISLEKGSGFVRRGVEDSARNFRQEVEREYRTEIRQLREESASKDRVILMLQSEFVQLRSEFQSYKEANQKPLALERDAQAELESEPEIPE